MRYVTNIHSINTLKLNILTWLHFTFPQASFCSCISYFLTPLCLWSLAPSFCTNGLGSPQSIFLCLLSCYPDLRTSIPCGPKKTHACHGN